MSILQKSEKSSHIQKRTNQMFEVKLKMHRLAEHFVTAAASPLILPLCHSCMNKGKKKRKIKLEEKKQFRQQEEENSVPFKSVRDIFALESGSEIMLTVPGETGAAVALPAQTWPCGTELPAATCPVSMQQQPLTAKQGRSCWHNRFSFACSY